MNLLSLFRKEKVPTPANRLEELFLQAALDPGKRPDFCRQLFHFNLLVWGEGKRKPDGTVTIQAGVREYDKSRGIWAFTSVEKINQFREGNKIGVVPYIGINSLDLFKLYADKDLDIVVNPFGAPGKVFKPSEIKAMISAESPVEGIEIPIGEKVAIGRPAHKPPELIAAMKSYASNHSSINQIYFSMIKMSEDVPRLSIGVDIKEDSKEKNEIIQDLIKVSKELDLSQFAYAAKGVDFFLLAGDEGAPFSRNFFSKFTDPIL